MRVDFMRGFGVARQGAIARRPDMDLIPRRIEQPHGIGFKLDVKAHDRAISGHDLSGVFHDGPGGTAGDICLHELVLAAPVSEAAVKLHLLAQQKKITCRPDLVMAKGEPAQKDQQQNEERKAREGDDLLPFGHCLIPFRIWAGPCAPPVKFLRKEIVQ